MDAVKFVVAFSALVNCYSAAPAEPPISACLAITPEDSATMITCCAYVVPFSNETMESCSKKEMSGTLSKEFECVQDCLFASDKVLGPDKKFDPAAWKEHATKLVEGDWKEVVADSGGNCDEFYKTFDGAIEKKCQTSHSDMAMNCMTVNWYLNCPKSAWTSSETCNTARDKLKACFSPLFQKS